MSIERLGLGKEKELLLVGLFMGADVKLFDAGKPAKTVEDSLKVIEKMGVQFDLRGLQSEGGFLTIGAKGCEDMILKVSQDAKKTGLYLPFMGIVAPLTKWLRHIDLHEDGNSFKLFFGDHPKDRKGEDTLVYTYEKSFSLKYEAA